MKNYITLLLLVSILISCKKKPTIEGFNSELWKNDKKGCNGKRLYMGEKLLNDWKAFKGMDDDEVAELFGNPEGSEWENRGKKTYFYYIQQGSQCDKNRILEGTKIAIEFDALGRVNLITERKF